MAEHASSRPLVDAAYLAERTGRTVRYWQRMAAEERINFARQPLGPRTPWYFDLREFELWMESNGRKGAWRAKTLPTRTGETAGTGGASHTRVKISVTPLRQKIEQLQSGASKRGLTGSKTKPGEKSLAAPLMKLLTPS